MDWIDATLTASFAAHGAADAWRLEHDGAGHVERAGMRADVLAFPLVLVGQPTLTLFHCQHAWTPQSRSPRTDDAGCRHARSASRQGRSSALDLTDAAKHEYYG